VPVLLLALVLLLGLGVEAVDLDGQGLDLLAISQLHLAHEVGNDEVDDGVGQDFFAELVDLAVGGHHAQQLLALLQLLPVQTPQNVVHVCVCVVVDGHVEVECGED